MALLVLPTVFAATCTDGDNPSKGSKVSDFILENASRVYYGITPKDDVCVTAPEGVSAAESLFLREYYCTTGNDTLRKYEDIDCTKHGYTGCKAGSCYGKKSSSSSNTTSAPVSDCGNKIVEKAKGEQCDPPGDICFGSGGAYGQCTSSCLCELASSFKNKCGNGVLESGEVCESDADCASGKCVSCACTGSVATSNATTSTTTTNTSVETVVPEPEPVVENKSDVVSLNESFVQVEEIAVENFSDSAGIKATGALSRFFTGLWSWFAGLFS